MAEAKHGSEDVKGAARTLAVFEAFADEARALTLSELAKRLEVPVSSCSLLIRTLLRRGYLYEAAGRYYPTRRMLEHVTHIADSDVVVARLAPVLSAVRDRTQETTTLAKRHGAQAIFLATFDAPGMLRPYVFAGSRRPLHSTAAGKALLGSLDAESRAALLDAAPLARFTPHTRTRTQLEAELRTMTARGWFTSEGENVAELGGLAVPVQVLGDCFAITIVGPNYRIKRKAQQHAETLLQAIGGLAPDGGVFRKRRRRIPMARRSNDA